MIADHLAKRISNWGNDRMAIQVWRRWDGMFRVVQLERIADSSRYRETKGETVGALEAAILLADRWKKEERKALGAWEYRCEGCGANMAEVVIDGRKLPRVRKCDSCAEET